MEKKSATGSRNRILALGLFLVLLAAGLWAVYGNSMQEGNVAGATSCEGSAQATARLAGLNVGDVAAFAIADAPKFIGDLTFNDETGTRTSLST
ncbi:MAG: hypothetical protein KDJ51_12750, partial [Nitratireductor sp.]|nr:hypothetical protein [Nitratireductor sp.]